MPVQPNRSIGLKSDSVQFPMAQITSFRNPLRTLTVDDTLVSNIPSSEYLPGLQSRSGVNNQIEVLVACATAGVIIDLYIVEDGIFYKRDSYTTIDANQSFSFTGVPAFPVALMVTNIGAGATIAAGITR